MKGSKIIILFIFILILSSIDINAKPTIAFGYMYNIRNESELNSLEFIFPNSFANSIKAIFDVTIKKPLEIENELAKTGKSLQKNYEYIDLPELIKEIKSDIFIFGNFNSAPDNQIKIVLNMYIKGHSEIFTFTNYGRMETQVSKIVDRITIIILNFLSEQNLYKTKNIIPGTKLAVLTNLEGEELNSVLSAFLEKGYPLVCFQNNDLHNPVNDSTIEKFSYIKTRKNSFDTITDWRKTEFYYSTWTGKKYEDRIKYSKKLYNTYDLNFDSIMDGTLEKISSSYNDSIDVMLIVGFSENRKKSWVRAIDMKEKELIWMQSNFESGLLSFDPITDNVHKIVEGMTAEPANPFLKLDNTAGKE